MLGGHVRVAKILGEAIGAIEHARQFAREGRLARRPGLLGKTLDFPLGLGPKLGHIEARLLQQGRDDALILLEQGEKQVRVVDDRVAPTARINGRLL